MPAWEQRLVSITARWAGLSVTNAKGKCVLRYRVTGEDRQQVTLPPPLLYRETDEAELITWCRAIYKAWDGGKCDLKDALASVAPRSTKQGEQHSLRWSEVVAAYRAIRTGNKCSESTWTKNWEPFLNEAVKVLSSKKAETGYELLKAVMRKWKDAPTMQISGARILQLFMEYAVARHGVSGSMLILEVDKDELLPKKPKRKKKAVLLDSELLTLIEIADKQDKGWGNVLRVLTQYGLRPVEFQYLTVEKHPNTGKLTFYCSYEKIGGEEETEPRYVQPMFLRDSSDQPIQWDLERAWHDGTLQLPKVSKIDGGRINGFLHPSHKGAAKNDVEAYWLKLRTDYAAKKPTEWCRPYSLRDSYSVRSHREGVPEPSICQSMGHGIEVHRRSYRTITNAIVARDYAKSEVQVQQSW
jgi:integrase